jgi:MFS family permease
MVKLQVLENRLFRTTITVSFFSTAAFMGTLFTVPLFLQEGVGVSPLTSGLTVFPEALGVVVSTQLVARVYPRVGPARLMGFGLVWVAIVLTTLSFVPFSVSLWTFRGLMFALGCGMACIFVSNQAAALGTISRADTGRASMLMSVQRQIGAATGVAVVSSVLAAIGLFDALGPNHRAYQVAFLTAAGIALLGSLFATLVPDADAAVTMVGPSRRRAVTEPEPVPASSGN